MATMTYSPGCKYYFRFTRQIIKTPHESYDRLAEKPVELLDNEFCILYEWSKVKYYSV